VYSESYIDIFKKGKIMQDKNGREFQIGDRIVHSYKSSHGIVTRHGRITNIIKNRVVYYDIIDDNSWQQLRLQGHFVCSRNVFLVSFNEYNTRKYVKDCKKYFQTT